MDIAGRSAVVSGAASGLGAAVARRLVAEGARVALLDLDEERGAALAAELGDAARFLRADVSQEPQVEEAIASATEVFGGVHLAVSCAGVLGAGRLLGRNGPLAGEVFEGAVGVNLVGTFLLARTAAAAMQDNAPDEGGERGVIVNTASVAAWEGQIGQIAYAASKAGVIGMTLPMARELARVGVRVMTIAPGVFTTPMMAGVKDEVRQSLADQVPFPSRLGNPEEFADLVVSIARNRYLNGETIRLDGAIRMQAR